MSIVGSVILVLFIAFLIYIAVLFARHLMLFNSVPCTECDSYMEFKGEKKTNKGNVYIFQCPKCNAVREVPTKEFNSHLYDLYNNNINMC